MLFRIGCAFAAVFYSAETLAQDACRQLAQPAFAINDTSPGADAISDWTATANAIARQSSQVHAHGLAILHAAMSKAMKTVEREARAASAEAAAAAAAHEVLVALYPDQSVDLSLALADALAKIGNGVPKASGYAAGRKAAAAILAACVSATRNLITGPNRHAWRAVRLGAHTGVRAYREAFEKAKIKVGDSADEILGRPSFLFNQIKGHLQLALRSAAELGMEAERSSLSAIYARARQTGLELSPAEAAAQLRLDYTDQPLGEMLHVAMEPIATYHGNPMILALANGGAGLLLIGSDGSPGFMAPKTWRFVFALPPVVQARPADARGQTVDPQGPTDDEGP